MSRALPPCGWHRTMLHEAQVTTVCAWLNTVVLHEEHTTDGNVSPWLPGTEKHTAYKQGARGRHAHVEAARALHVHEERVGGLHQPLQLMPASLNRRKRVQQVDLVRRLGRLQGAQKANRVSQGTERMREASERAHAPCPRRSSRGRTTRTARRLASGRRPPSSPRRGGTATPGALPEQPTGAAAASSAPHPPPSLHPPPQTPAPRPPSLRQLAAPVRESTQRVDAPSRPCSVRKQPFFVVCFSRTVRSPDATTTREMTGDRQSAPPERIIK